MCFILALVVILQAGSYFSPHSYPYSESCIPTAVSCPVSTNLSSLAIRREDSPDSGIGEFLFENEEVQKSVPFWLDVHC